MKILLVVALSLLLFNPVLAQAPVSPADMNTTSSMYLSVSPEIRSLMVKTDATFERIAVCESNNNPKEKNTQSTASGRFQFLKGTWNYYGKKLWGDDLKNKDVFNYFDNTELAWYVYTTYGSRDWDASSGCWLRE